MKRLMVILLLFWSCENFTGPEGTPGEQGATGEQGLPGEQGDTGPAYPIHNHGTISGSVWEDDVQPYYHGINFDTNSNWYGIRPEDTTIYDVLFTLDFNSQRQIKISPGNNPFTEIYLIETVISLRGIISLPDQSQKRNIIIFGEYDSPIYLMIKNRYNRWAKIKFSDQSWYYNPYTWSEVNHYTYWSIVEWYYYKDLEPDLTLHKVQ